MKRLAIIHFNPVEKYPPVMNWLDFLGAQAHGEWEVRVFTTHPDKGLQGPYRSANSHVDICRFGTIRKGKPLYRYLAYLAYYTRTLSAILRWRPDTVLYYETLSALPALVYKKYFRRNAGLFVHYHEYSTPQEYLQGMILTRWFHRWERKMYPAYTWISHTNKDRMRLFTDENRNIAPSQTHILPNYPPSSWRERAHKQRSDIVRFVYVGALSLDSIYMAEFAGWVENQNGRVSWDIYSSNCTTDAKNFIASLNSAHITFHGGVDYASLPDILQAYDIGLVLYKGTIPNYVYNIPNKLFEYFACELDVWFAKEMKTCMELVTSGVYPKITPVDFSRLNQLNLQEVLDRSGLVKSPSPFYCEGELAGLLGTISNQRL